MTKTLTQLDLPNISQEDLNKNMRVYKITKYFRGGCRIYHALLPKSFIVKRKCWEYQLEDWGENTDGGHCYGYHILSTTVKTIPKQSKGQLHFNGDYIQRKEK